MPTAGRLRRGALAWAAAVICIAGGGVADADAAKPSVRLADAAVTEGDPPEQLFAQVRASLSRKARRPVRIRWTTGPPGTGSAAGPLDYAATGGTLRIPKGKRSGVVSVQILRDLFAEPTEAFLVAVTGVRGARVADGTARVRVFDDDGGADADADGIPDHKDCAPEFPNPPGETRCVAPATPYSLNSGQHASSQLVQLDELLVLASAPAANRAWAAVAPGDPGYTGPEHSAIELNTSLLPIKPLAGDRVRLLGVATPEPFQPEQASTTANDVPLPAPLTLAPPDLTPALDDVLISVGPLTVATQAAGGWSTTEGVGVGALLIGTLPAYYPDGTTFGSITGIADGGGPGVLPRGASDFEAPARLASFGPATCLAEGSTGFVDLYISYPVNGDTAVTISSSDSQIATADSPAIVGAGLTYTPVNLTGVSQGTTTLTAALGSDELDLEVTVSSSCP